MKKIHLVFAVSITVLVALVLLSLGRPISSSLLAAEKVFIDDDLYMIGFIDIDGVSSYLKAGEVDKLYSGKEMVGTIPSLLVKNARLRGATEHAVIGYSSFEGGASALVLRGKESWASMPPEFESSYIITEAREGYYHLVKKQEKNLCKSDEEIAETVYAAIHEQWLLVSQSKNYLDKIKGRLVEGYQAEGDFVDSWNSFRGTALTGVAVFSPKQFTDENKGKKRFLAKKASLHDSEVTSFFLTGDVNLIKQEFVLKGRISASEKWARKQKELFNSALSEFRTNVKELSPTASNLLERISVSQTGEYLNATVNVQDDVIWDLQPILNELFAYAFMGEPSNPEILEESINTSVWDFSNNDKLVQNTLFKETSSSGAPQFVKGIFGVNLDSASFNEQIGLVELNIKAMINVPKIEGWWSSSKAELAISIDSVRNSEGENLLRNEQCIERLETYGAKNHEVSKGFSTSDNLAYEVKTLRLNKGVGFNDVDKVLGEVFFTVPVGVKSYDVSHKRGTIATTPDLVVVVKEAKRQSVLLEFDGNTDKLIEVRALNERGEVLNFNSYFGNDMRKSYQFKGDIDSLQLLYADEIKTVSKGFVINRADLLKTSKNNNSTVLPLPSKVVGTPQSEFDNVDSQALIKVIESLYPTGHNVASDAVSHVGLSLNHNFSSSWEYRPKLKLAVPFIPELVNNLHSVSVELQSDGREEVYYKDFSPPYKIGLDGLNGSYQASSVVSDKGFMSATLSIFDDLDRGIKLNEVSGDVVLRLPRKVDVTDLGLLPFGRVVSHEDKLIPNIGEYKFKVSSVDFGFIPRYTIEFMGEGILNIVAYDEKMDRLAKQASFENGWWKLQFDNPASIKGFKVLHSNEIEVMRYPFKLKPRYSIE
tara:strand:- start:8602 stop:11235 length:2634 start_codon:yes stop_codon:yes gene_type:complete